MPNSHIAIGVAGSTISPTDRGASVTSSIASPYRNAAFLSTSASDQSATRQPGAASRNALSDTAVTVIRRRPTPLLPATTSMGFHTALPSTMKTDAGITLTSGHSVATTLVRPGTSSGSLMRSHNAHERNVATAIRVRPYRRATIHQTFTRKRWNTRLSTQCSQRRRWAHPHWQDRCAYTQIVSKPIPAPQVPTLLASQVGSPLCKR